MRVAGLSLWVQSGVVFMFGGSGRKGEAWVWLVSGGSGGWMCEYLMVVP